MTPEEVIMKRKSGPAEGTIRNKSTSHALRSNSVERSTNEFDNGKKRSETNLHACHKLSDNHIRIGFSGLIRGTGRNVSEERISPVNNFIDSIWDPSQQKKADNLRVEALREQLTDKSYDNRKGFNAYSQRAMQKIGTGINTIANRSRKNLYPGRDKLNMAKGEDFDGQVQYRGRTAANVDPKLSRSASVSFTPESKEIYKGANQVFNFLANNGLPVSKLGYYKDQHAKVPDSYQNSSGFFFKAKNKVHSSGRGKK